MVPYSFLPDNHGLVQKKTSRVLEHEFFTMMNWERMQGGPLPVIYGVYNL